MSNPRQYKIPDWFLNRQKDIKDGKKTKHPPRFNTFIILLFSFADLNCDTQHILVIVSLVVVNS